MAGDVDSLRAQPWPQGRERGSRLNRCGSATTNAPRSSASGDLCGGCGHWFQRKIILCFKLPGAIAAMSTSSAPSNSRTARRTSSRASSAVISLIQGTRSLQRPNCLLRAPQHVGRLLSESAHGRLRRYRRPGRNLTRNRCACVACDCR